jgi:hypothetical protein
MVKLLCVHKLTLSLHRTCIFPFDVGWNVFQDYNVHYGRLAVVKICCMNYKIVHFPVEDLSSCWLSRASTIIQVCC